ncbi:Gfo/Idh/MocA family protein [Bacillus mobilis]|uniref:Gfo/Idh/MocA family protein n=1 Tax=Bacillus mobilis TaxID=2026190 RepID=UPI000A3012A7|nr:Gfo/Idh/MocA family oxidoreductase [Bacillus mobilis]MCU5594433.1 Gfo/Idh/MocA family oxidoreductase [Bacillus mobilis]MCU5735376.1 Gfo/Idh/MocA family oxidoreductase [Bacillus mobilis]MCU9560166.1 Gfo/Idh/MocA family oxidoreductase [Bacillus mobilis]SMD72087.1 Putative 4,5-dihydroxyphthalate dehydrogenase [Bacillus mobilis]HDR7514035.1 Gfo/Idh/MocA family oxidoreductase [Bacillus mobilis]
MNFAIIGCGHIAKKHAEAIQNIDGANLIAICDRVPAAMEYYVEKYDAKPYEDMKDLLVNPEIDVVTICTPSGYHAQITVEIAKAKKHVIVEKPIALTIEDANLMIKVCEEQGVKLAVVHPNRFRPAVQEFHKLMAEGRLGKISHANATVRWNRNDAYYAQAPWRGTKALDGGVLMNQAIHNIDLLVWLMGEVEEVYSMGATRLRNIEAEDVSTGVVRFKNGALGVVEAAATIYPKNLEESLSIFGETGTVKIGGMNANQFTHLNVESLDEEETNVIIEKVKSDPLGKPGHQCIIEDMIEAIQQNRTPIVSGEDGKRALQFVLAFYESAETQQKIKIDEKNLVSIGG